MKPSITIDPGAVLEVLRSNGAPPKKYLENALAPVDKNVRDTVVAVLYDAKIEKILGEMAGRQIDFVRELQKHTVSASYNLKELRRSLETRMFDDTIKWFDKINALPFDSRRKKEGRHPQPWIDKARKKLKGLGVPRELSADLLLACGISRPRSKNDD